MKTQNNKLRFNKNTMVELNNNELLDVNGGTSTFCLGIIVGMAITFKLK